METVKTTELGKILLGDSIELLKITEDNSIDLIFTSPPFDLINQKTYGNKKGDEYQEWMFKFGAEFFRVLKQGGSLVLDLGSGWTPGFPTKNLFEYRLLINFIDEIGFHLAQDFFWWDPTRLPTPAQWVTVERVRVKDAVNKIWWLSKTQNPKANNKNVLQDYSKAMRHTINHGTNVGKRASGHDVSRNFEIDNGGSIPPNLIAISNSISKDDYSEFCKANGFTVHPARIHPLIPEFFIRFLTDEGDTVLDPFAGSCVTGAVANKLNRNWTCCDLNKEYLLGAIGRFSDDNISSKTWEKRREYTIAAPNFNRQKKLVDEILAEQSQFNLFET